jgi:uncharacterized membrane protein YdjX (TVP38/TMEM64 family)
MSAPAVVVFGAFASALASTALAYLAARADVRDELVRARREAAEAARRMHEITRQTFIDMLDEVQRHEDR